MNPDSPVGLIVELAVADVEVVSWDIARAYVLTDVQDRSRRKLCHEVALVDTTPSRVLPAIIRDGACKDAGKHEDLNDVGNRDDRHLG